MEFFLTIVNGLKPLTIGTKDFILDVEGFLDMPLKCLFCSCIEIWSHISGYVLMMFILSLSNLKLLLFDGNEFSSSCI